MDNEPSETTIYLPHVGLLYNRERIGYETHSYPLYLIMNCIPSYPYYFRKTFQKSGRQRKRRVHIKLKILDSKNKQKWLL